MLCSKVILIHLDFSFGNIILENSCLVLIEPTLWGPHQVVVIFKASSSLLSHLTSCMAGGDWSEFRFILVQLRVEILWQVWVYP